MSEERVIKSLTALKRGGLVIVADDKSREAEGDMIGIAELVKPETVNRMISSAKGLLCVPMSRNNADRLGLSPIVSSSHDRFQTAFTLSVDSNETKTGISAYERAKTIKSLADSTSLSKDFFHPGHVFPLVAKDGGVVERRGHTEAAVDLARLAGCNPVSYICEIVKKNGQMARTSELKAMAEGLEIPFLTIEDIVEYRIKHEDNIIRDEADVHLPTVFGNFKLRGFSSIQDSRPILSISKNVNVTESIPLVRLHSECLTGDVFGSKRCDCGEQLHNTLNKIENDGNGMVLYLPQEGRGIGLLNKLKAYELQEQGLDTVQANEQLGFQPDERSYDLAAATLYHMGINKIRLLTNNPDKVQQLAKYGIEVAEVVPIQTEPTSEDLKYLKTKKKKFHHQLDL